MRALFDAAVAQLVERNLAKVEVESSRLFCRSSFTKETYRRVCIKKHFLHGAIAKRLCTGLQIRVGRFDSGSRLQEFCGSSSVGRAQPCQG
jgi:hypothetical protein